jgi:lactosylceramide 4-alpha-galactosyltransferase
MLIYILFVWLFTGPFIHVHRKLSTTKLSQSSETSGSWFCNFSQPEDANSSANIYFLETSGAPYLSLRQLCAVESAAKANPGYNVVVGMLGGVNLVNLTKVTRKIVDNYKNVRLVQLDPRTWMQGTPMSPDTSLGRRLFEKLNKSMHKV